MPPTTTPPLRLATPADVDELVRLRRVMLDALGAGEGAAWEDACAAFLRETLAAGTAAAVVADDPEAPGRLVACGVGTIDRRLPAPRNPDGLHGYIASMVTEPAWRGRGLAAGIVEELLAWLGERGVYRVDLHASRDGEPIYRRLGFTESPFPELVRPGH